MEIYDKLGEVVSPEINFHRYRQDIRIVHQSACVPHLGMYMYTSQCNTVNNYSHNINAL